MASLSVCFPIQMKIFWISYLVRSRWHISVFCVWIWCSWLRDFWWSKSGRVFLLFHHFFLSSYIFQQYQTIENLYFPPLLNRSLQEADIPFCQEDHLIWIAEFLKSYQVQHHYSQKLYIYIYIYVSIILFAKMETTNTAYTTRLTGMDNIKQISW